MASQEECPCCGKLLGQRQIRNHLAVWAPPPDPEESEGDRATLSPMSDIPTLPGEDIDEDLEDYQEPSQPENNDVEMRSEDLPNPIDDEAGRLQAAAMVEDWVEFLPSDSEEEPGLFGTQPLPSQQSAPSNHPPSVHSSTHPPDGEEDGEDDDLDDPEFLRRIEELYGDEWLEDIQAVYDEGLSPDDLDNVIMYAIRVDNHLSRKTYNAIRRGFAHKLSLRSEYRAQKLIEKLTSELECPKYDCCINSCCMYVEDYSELTHCPYCKDPRYDKDGRPRETFTYIPVIPRLKAYFANTDLAETLDYRAKYDDQIRRPNPNTINDVFDSTHYRTLLDQKVKVAGQTLGHNFFSEPDDIALGLAGDGIQVFGKYVRRGNSTVTPIIVLNYNLPPHLRTRLENVLCIGVIPGPHGPKDLNSFLIPWKRECEQLAVGIRAYHAGRQAAFTLHAYNILGLGDIPWISKLMNIKGHNGFCPCRSCRIQGVSNPFNDKVTYYVPLAHPVDDPDVARRKEAWIPSDLPLRTDESFVRALNTIRSLPTKARREEAAIRYGINGEALMSHIPGISMTRSFPWEFMHLLFENVISNLIALWRGKFGKLTSGTEDYVIDQDIWDTIGEETSGKNLRAVVP